MNKSIDERLLAFASREDLEKALLELNPDQVVLIGYVDHTGDIVRWSPKMDAQGRLITAPVEERVQQALSTNNAEWVERLQQLEGRIAGTVSIMSRNNLLDAFIKDEFKALITTHSKENL